MDPGNGLAETHPDAEDETGPIRRSHLVRNYPPADRL